jgi:myosin heavy subunit
LFDAIEWTLTGKIDHFSEVDGKDKVGNYLRRWGGTSSESSSTLTFSDGQTVGRELDQQNVRYSILTGVQEVAEYLRVKEWQAPITALSRYLSLTHFLGQSSLSRITHRTPPERLEILKEVSESKSLQELGTRLHGPGTTSTARAFVKRISDLQQRLDHLTVAVRQEEELWLGAQASGALDDSESLVLSREIERLLNVANPLVSNVSDALAFAKPLDVIEIESAVIECGALSRDREHSIIEARRLLQARERIKSALNQSSAALQGSEPELASAIAEVTAAQQELVERQSVLTETSNALTVATELHAEFVALKDAIAASRHARSERETSASRLSEGRTIFEAAEAEVQLAERWLKFEARLKREIERLEGSRDSSRNRITLGTTVLDCFSQLTKLEASLSDRAKDYGDLEEAMSLAKSDLEAARDVESEATNLLEVVELSVGAVSSAIAIVAEHLSDDSHDCPVCSTHFESAAELSSRAHTAASRLAPKVVAQQKLVSEARASVHDAEKRLKLVADASDAISRYRSQRKLLLDSKTRLLESMGLSVDSDSSEVEKWIAAHIQDLARYEFSISVRARRLELILRGDRAHGQASDAARKRDRAAIQLEKLTRELDDRVRAERISFDHLSSISIRLFPTGMPDDEGLEAAIQSTYSELSLRKQAYDAAAASSSQQSLKLGQCRAVESQLRARMSKLASDHSTAVSALGQLTEQWIAIGFSVEDMSDERLEAISSNLNLGRKALQDAEAVFSRFRIGREAWSRQLASRAAIDDLRMHLGLSQELRRDEIRGAAKKELEKLQDDLTSSKDAKEIASSASVLIAQAVNEFNADYLDPLKLITNSVNQAILCDPRIGIDFNVQKRGIKQSGFVIGEMPKNLSGVDPVLVHSEGQMAALAVSMLCAASLTYPWSRWRGLVLDDPLQHNDAIHVSAFADLMGNLISGKGYQLLLTTHDLGQAEFLKRKFEARGIGCGLLSLLGRGSEGVEWSYRNASDELARSVASA